MLHAALLRATLTAALTAPGWTQTLVHDLNVFSSGSAPPGSFPFSGTDQNGLAYFSASREPTGAEPWRTDGTVAGTLPLGDLNPGKPDSVAQHYTALPSGRVLFVATDVAHGRELWVTDGTEAGTSLVLDIRPGPDSSDPRGLTALGGEVFFLANDGVVGRELWKSDGTPGGTELVADVVPGVVGATNNVVSVAAAGGKLFFGVYSAPNWQLWKSDGTASGTVFLAVISDHFFGFPVEMTPLGNLLVFVSDHSTIGSEPYVSDGTPAGTTVLKNIAPGPEPSNPRYLLRVGNHVYFSAGTAALGHELYRTDGTVAGTVLVKDVAPGVFGSSPRPMAADVTGTRVFFSANTPDLGIEPWISDGTDAGTVLVADIRPGAASSNAFGTVLIGNELILAADDGSSGRELWSTDGTAAGTQLVADIQPGPGASQVGTLTGVGGLVVLSADDGVHGAEPWVSDGTAVGTVLLRDVAHPQSSDSSYPTQLTRFEDRLVFVAGGGIATGRELWSSDGTAAGTAIVQDLYPGPGSSDPSHVSAIGGLLWMAARDGPVGREPFVSDGTPQGAVLLQDIFPGSFSSDPGPFRPLGAEVLFAATAPLLGRELWKSDGTPEGTTLLSDLAIGSPGSAPDHLHRHFGLVYFSADDGATGRELYTTDGTAAGTAAVIDLQPGPGSGLVDPQLTSFAGAVYLRADDGVSGAELWRTSGTAAGTLAVADIRPGPESSDPGDFAVLGGLLVFTADDGVNGRQLWSHDGTPGGTQLVRLLPGEPRSPLFVQGAEAYLWVDSPGGDELWRTDGTAAGTQPAGLFDPSGSGQFQPAFATPGSGGVLVLQASDGLGGAEPWAIGGSPAGPALLAEIAPGPGGSSPADFERVGDRLYFRADDGTTGSELHAVALADIPEYLAEPLGTGCPGTGGLVPTIAAGGAPVVGAPFTVELAQALPASPALLLVSLGSGHLDAGGGCTLHVAPGFAALALATDAGGQASAGFVPAPGQVGLYAVFQYVAVDPGGAFSGLLSATGALEVVVGP